VAAAVLATRRHIETGWLELDRAMKSQASREAPAAAPDIRKSPEFAET